MIIENEGKEFIIIHVDRFIRGNIMDDINNNKLSQQVSGARAPEVIINLKILEAEISRVDYIISTVDNEIEVMQDELLYTKDSNYKSSESQLQTRLNELYKSRIEYCKRRLSILEEVDRLSNMANQQDWFFINGMFGPKWAKSQE